MKVTAVCSPNVRESLAVGAFVDACSAALGTPISIAETAPADGYVISFDEPGVEISADLAHRLVYINAERWDTLQLLEQLEVVAAVDKHSYLQWVSGPRSTAPGRGVIGRKDVATRMGASLQRGPFKPTEHYESLISGRSQDLPSTLAEYLLAFHEVRGRG
jgi:hypothetical protein